MIEGERKNSKPELLTKYTLQLDPTELADMDYETHLTKHFCIDEYPNKMIEYSILCHRDYEDEKSYSISIDAWKNKVEINGKL